MFESTLTGHSIIVAFRIYPHLSVAKRNWVKYSIGPWWGDRQATQPVITLLVLKLLTHSLMKHVGKAGHAIVQVNLRGRMQMQSCPHWCAILSITLDHCGSVSHPEGEIAHAFFSKYLRVPSICVCLGLL